MKVNWGFKPEVITTAKKIAKLLTEALLHDGKMAKGLFDFEFEAEDIAEFKATMKRDNDDYFFAVTENTGHVAMILIEKSGEVLANEQARDRLKEYWQDNYENNLKRMIPSFAMQLAMDQLPINGIRIAPE